MKGKEGGQRKGTEAVGVETSVWERHSFHQEAPGSAYRIGQLGPSGRLSSSFEVLDVLLG